MNPLKPVDVIVDFPMPESGYFTTELMVPPCFTSAEVAKIFFAVQQPWLSKMLRKVHVLDGELIRFNVARRLSNGSLAWRLWDIERFAQAAAQDGYIGTEALLRALVMVRTIAEAYDYLPPTVPTTRVETYDPARRGEVYVIYDQSDPTDDLDGAVGARERAFSLGDVQYRIDLTDEHWTELVVALAPYLKVARRKSSRTDDPELRPQRAQVRAWAKQNGYQIGDRGRIPQQIMRAYLNRPDSRQDAASS